MTTPPDSYYAITYCIPAVDRATAIDLLDRIQALGLRRPPQAGVQAVGDTLNLYLHERAASAALALLLSRQAPQARTVDHAPVLLWRLAQARQALGRAVPATSPAAPQCKHCGAPIPRPNSRRACVACRLRAAALVRQAYVSLASIVP